MKQVSLQLDAEKKEEQRAWLKRLKRNEERRREAAMRAAALEEQAVILKAKHIEMLRLHLQKQRQQQQQQQEAQEQAKLRPYSHGGVALFTGLGLMQPPAVDRQPPPRQWGRVTASRPPASGAASRPPARWGRADSTAGAQLVIRRRNNLSMKKTAPYVLAHMRERETCDTASSAPLGYAFAAKPYQ